MEKKSYVTKITTKQDIAKSAKTVTDATSPSVETLVSPIQANNIAALIIENLSARNGLGEDMKKIPNNILAGIQEDIKQIILTNTKELN